jgi:hypothetical protein
MGYKWCWGSSTAPACSCLRSDNPCTFKITMDCLLCCNYMLSAESWLPGTQVLAVSDTVVQSPSRFGQVVVLDAHPAPNGPAMHMHWYQCLSGVDWY